MFLCQQTRVEFKEKDIYWKNLNLENLTNRGALRRINVELERVPRNLLEQLEIKGKIEILQKIQVANCL